MSNRIELKNGMSAKVRTGRLGCDGIEWSDPFMATLAVDTDSKGRACGLYLKEKNYAEFDPRYHQESDTLFVAENYALEILPE